VRETFVQGSLAMPRGSLLRVEDGEGVLLSVKEGELWVTEEGSRKDHVLQAGQSFRIARGGVALGHAFRQSVICIAARRPGNPARRITLSRPGAADPMVLHQREELPAWQALLQFLVAPLREMS